MQEYKNYFFSLIGAGDGQNASNWKAVLESLPGKGMGTNPRPGERQPADAPHHGMTVMIDGGGNARGRIWLPSDEFTTDGNGNRWFTHEIQVIADGHGGMVWAWDSKGGATPRPFDAGIAPSPEPTPPTSDLEARVADLERRVTALESAGGGFPARIALKDSQGKYLCADRERKGTPVMANRDGVGAWETFDVESVE